MKRQLDLKSIIKKGISIAVISACLLSSVQPALAFEENESRSVEHFFIETQLLKGDGTGYGLEKDTTRMEGIIILIRLMGKEADAQTMQNQPCRFLDVPAWAAGYANYADANNISNGISDTLFGTNNNITAQQFNTMLLRTIGYDDGDFQWNDAVSKADDLEILPQDMADNYESRTKYTKKDLIETAFCYLDASEKDGDVTLIEKLIRDDVVQEKTAEKYGLAVDGWDSLKTDHYSDDYLNFEINDNQLNVTGTSDDKEKSWLLVLIKNQKTGAEKSQTVRKIGNDGQYDIDVSLANLSQGDYYVDIYGNDEKYNYYSSIILSSMILEKTEDGIYFKSSPTYGKNLRIYMGNQVDEQDYRMTLATRASKKSTAMIKELSDSITEDAGSDYEKVRKIHDWVADNIYYDNDFLKGKTESTNIDSVDVLKNKYAVCSGYANLTKDLITAAGIPCKQVIGYALGISKEKDWEDVDLRDTTPNHIWNEAYVDGRWIIIDTTWDSANDYDGGSFTYGGIRSYNYFDSSVEFFSDTHQTTSQEGL